jgi:hypothetical protein
MRSSFKFSREGSIMIAGAVASVLCSRNAWAQNWVMGGTQFAPTGAGLTEIFSAFTVPTPPWSFSAPISFWSGLEPADGTNLVLQPVLIYYSPDDSGNAAWYMRNEIQPNNIIGNIVQVSAGDEIETAVWLDSTNPGCNISSGSNCNYNIGWYDYTTGQTDILYDFKVPTTLGWAQGFIFETHPVNGPYDNCFNFPFNSGSIASVELFNNTPSGGTFTPVTTNLFIGGPGIVPFQDQLLSNGSSAFNTCGFGVSVGSTGPAYGKVTIGFAR